MRRINLAVVVVLSIFLINFISAETEFGVVLSSEKANWKNMTCEEKLESCVNYYNNCSADYHAGKNCGMAYGMLDSFNDELQESVEVCNEDLGMWKIASILEGIMIIAFFLLIIFGKKKE